MAGNGQGYRLHPLAQTDLEDIWRYTVRVWSPAQAERYHAGIVATLEALANGEREGRPVAVRDCYFKCPVESHVIFFRQAENGIDVVRVLHQRMDVSRHL